MGDIKENTSKKKHLALKVFLIIFIILIVLAIAITAIGYFYINNEKIKIQQANANAIKEIQETLEYGDSINYDSILEKLVASNEVTENSTVQIEVNGKILNPSEEYKLEEVGNVTVEVDGDLDVTVEGEFDASKAGTYTLTAKAVDKNGNEITQEFTVTVKEKEVAPSPKPTTSGSTSNNKKPNSSTGSSSSSGSSSAPESTASGRLSLAQAEARRVVSQIITPGMTNYQKADAICQYITNTVSVQSDQSLEAYKTNFGNEAYAALILKKAACSGRCKAVTLMCNAAGLVSQHINANQWTHQWNKVQMEDGSWIVIDTHPLEY